MAGWTQGSGGKIPPSDALGAPYHGAETVTQLGTTSGATGWFPQFFGNTAGGTNWNGPCTRGIFVGTTGGYLRVDMDAGPTGMTLPGLTTSPTAYPFAVTKIYGDSTCLGVVALY